jgi:hypothetical protein
MKHKNTRKIGYSGALDAIGDVFSAITANPWFIAAQLAFQGYSFLQEQDSRDNMSDAIQKQADLQRRQNEAEAAKARLQQEREARIRRANVTTTAANVGATGSSVVEGSIGSIGSTAIENISNINTKLGFATAIGQAQTEQYQAQADAQFWKSMGGIPNMLMSAGTMFGKSSTTKKSASGFSGSSFTASPFSSIG